ncbi:entericidin [Limoniibacter endophyticus]
MTKKIYATFGAVLIAAAMLSGCGNTIRGAGQDIAGTVEGTQAAGRSVERASR